MITRLYQKCIYRGFYVIIILFITFVVFNLSLFQSENLSVHHSSKRYFEETNKDIIAGSQSTNKDDETLGTLIKQFNEWFEKTNLSKQLNDDLPTVDIQVDPIVAAKIKAEFSTSTQGTEYGNKPHEHELEEMHHYEDVQMEKYDSKHEMIHDFQKNTADHVKLRHTNSSVILDLEKIQYLSNYRNPCWLEPLPLTNPYTTNRYGGKKEGYMSNLMPAWDHLYSVLKIHERKERLRCLPYFFVGGFPKCGTTDVYDKLIYHPMIHGCLFKEPHYWTRWRFWTGKCFWHQFLCNNGQRCIPDTWQCDGRPQCPDGSDEWNCEPPNSCSLNNGGCSHTCEISSMGPKCTCPRGYELKPDQKTCVGGVKLTDYIDLFDIAAEEIYKYTEVRQTDQGPVKFHPKITGEATPATFWDNHRWRDEPSNDLDTTEPRTLTANIITHLHPGVKNIVMIRNPTNRLYSDLLYFIPNASPKEFHLKVEKGINWFNNCTLYKSLRSCVYEPMDKERPPEGRYWHPVERLRIGMYSEYLRDWLQIVPQNQIMVVKLEDYSANRVNVLQRIVHFLDLDPMPDSYLSRWQSTFFKNSGARKYASQGQMLPETRQLLDDFYRPFNRELVKLLNDDSYLYD